MQKRHATQTKQTVDTCPPTTNARSQTLNEANAYHVADILLQDAKPLDLHLEVLNRQGDGDGGSRHLISMPRRSRDASDE
jgi:hypothetical protein